MKTKEVIMADLEYLIRDGLEDRRTSTGKGLIVTKNILRKVLFLLQEGEKFEKMWGELESDGKNYSHKYIATTKYLMDNIKQKYFPEPKSRRQRFNEIINRMTNYNSLGKISEVVHLLIKLRDEEL